MLLLDKLKVLFTPWWKNSKHSGIEAGLLALTNLSMQVAVFVATTPQDDKSTNIANSTQAEANSTEWNLIAPIVVPMITSSINIVIFIFFRQRVADKLLQAIKQHILCSDEHKNEHGYANIALIQNFDSAELSKGDVENISFHVTDASAYCEFIGEFSNIIPMTLYGRMAYLSLPEAHHALFAAGAFTISGCLLQKYLFDNLVKADKIIKEKNIEIQNRLGRDIRHYDAMVEGRYQSVENLALDKLIQEKTMATMRLNVSLSTGLMLNNIMYMSLSTLTMAIVGQTYPQLRGTQGLITFSFATNLFAGSLLRSIYVFGNTYSKSTVALNKIYALHQLLKEITELKNNPFLQIRYGVPFLQDNTVIELQNFHMVIPPKKEKLEEITDNYNIVTHNSKCARITSAIKCHKTKIEPVSHKRVIEKIEEIIESPASNLIDLPTSFTLQAGSMYRIFGESGKGKSKFLETILGIWPFAKGQILFSCQRNEVFCMPQEDLFVKGTLLQNIYYPDQVPTCFEVTTTKFKDGDTKYALNHQEGEILLKTMRTLGLGDEIPRLGTNKDWGADRDLSPGMKKRFGFLRMYMHAMHGSIAPKLIILDEATSSVDPNNAACIEGLIRKLRHKYPKVCILYIKHDHEINATLFNQAQKELEEADSYFYQGLEDCQKIDIKYSARKRTPMLLSGGPSRLSATSITPDDEVIPLMQNQRTPRLGLESV